MSSKNDLGTLRALEMKSSQLREQQESLLAQRNTLLQQERQTQEQVERLREQARQPLRGAFNPGALQGHVAWRKHLEQLAEQGAQVLESIRAQVKATDEEAKACAMELLKFDKLGQSIQARLSLQTQRREQKRMDEMASVVFRLRQQSPLQGAT